VSEFLTEQQSVLAVEPDVPSVRAGLRKALAGGPGTTGGVVGSARVRQRFSWEAVARH
jgi:hypothetical protein